MLQRKDTTNISELNDFFTSSEKVCETVLWIIRSLKLCGKRFEFPESDRSIYVTGGVLLSTVLSVPFSGGQATITAMVTGASAISLVAFLFAACTVSLHHERQSAKGAHPFKLIT